jgi:hypothetical protein
MKLHQLRYLAAVAQSGLNITAAAQKLHTSQPGVSKQIKLLEEAGFQIFVREGGTAPITPAGQQVIPGRCDPEAQSIRDLDGSAMKVVEPVDRHHPHQARTCFGDPRVRGQIARRLNLHQAPADHDVAAIA